MKQNVHPSRIGTQLVVAGFLASLVMLIPEKPVQAVPPAASYSDVEKALGQEDYLKARELTDAILQTGLPQERDRLLPLYPRLLLGLGKVEEAKACIQRLSGAEQGPGRKGKASTPTAPVFSGEQLAIYRAWIASLEGKRAQGVRELEKMLEQAGDSPSETLAEAAEVLSLIYLQQDDTEKAQKVVDLGLKILQYRGASGYLLPLLKNRMASQAQRLFNQAENLRKAGKFSEAIPVYRQVQTKFPKDLLIHPSGFYIGDCMWRMDRAEEAAEHWRKFVKAAPAGPYRGQAMVSLCDLALQTELNLKDAAEYSMSAGATLSKGVDAQAEPSWREASFDIYTRVGVVSLVEHRYEAAVQAFENAKLAKEGQGTAAKPLSPGVQAGLDRLIEAAQKKSALVPEEFEGLGDPKAVTALALGSLFHVLHQYDLAQEYFALPLTGLMRSRTAAHRSFAGMGLARAIAANERSGGKTISSTLLDKLHTGGKSKTASPKRTGTPAPSPSVSSQVESLCKASIEEYSRGGWHDETLFCLATAIENHAEATAAKQQQKPATAKAKPEAPAPRAADPVHAVATEAKAQKDRLAALMKLKQEALPYYEELLAKYSQSPHREAASYHAAVLRCGLAEVASPAKEETLWQEADTALRHFTKEFPKSPLAGDVFVRRIDIALEHTFDVSIAAKVVDKSIAWAKEQKVEVITTADGRVTAQSLTDAAKAIRDAAVTIPPWREGEARPADALLNDLYNLYFRAGILAYIQERFDEAPKYFEAAGPARPTEGMRGNLDVQKFGVFILKECCNRGEYSWDSDAVKAAKNETHRLVLRLADTYAHAQRPEKALAIYRRLLTGNSSLGRLNSTVESYCMMQLAAVYSEEESNYEKSLAYYKQFYRKEYADFPWAADAIMQMAVLEYNKTQDPRQSIQHYQYILSRYPNHREAERALYFLAIAAVQLGDKALAERTCREYLDRYSRNHWKNSSWRDDVQNVLNNEVPKLRNRKEKP